MCKQLRWQEGPLPPTTTTTTPFSCFPGRVLLGGDSVSASHLHAIFYSITCCALPTSASKAPELIVKPLCDLIRLISFECGDNRRCLSPIRCHLFFWTHNLPETAVVTSVSENSEFGAGFGQPSFHEGCPLNQSLSPAGHTIPEEVFLSSQSQGLSTLHSLFIQFPNASYSITFSGSSLSQSLWKRVLVSHLQTFLFCSKQFSSLISSPQDQLSPLLQT